MKLSYIPERDSLLIFLSSLDLESSSSVQVCTEFNKNGKFSACLVLDGIDRERLCITKFGC